MMVRWLLIAVLALFMLAHPRCFADGKVFPVIDHRASIPDQQALIAWRDGIETLAIETRFVGTGTDFAWVVPLPSVPLSLDGAHELLRHVEGVSGVVRLAVELDSGAGALRTEFDFLPEHGKRAAYAAVARLALTALTADQYVRRRVGVAE